MTNSKKFDKLKAVKQSKKIEYKKEDEKMANEKIEEIMLEASEEVYLFQVNETFEDPFRVWYLVQGAIDRIDLKEGKNLTGKEVYDLYYRQITDFVESVL